MMNINKVILVMVIFANLIAGSHNQTALGNNKTPIQNWLISDAISVKFPVSNNYLDIQSEPFKAEDLLKFEYLDVKNLRPKEKAIIKFSGEAGLWSQAITKEESVFIPNEDINDKYEVHYLVSYIEANRWFDATLKVNSDALIEAYIDGNSIGGIYHLTKDQTTFTKSLEFEKKNYALVIKVLHKKEATIQVELDYSEKYKSESFSLKISPEHYMDIDHVLSGPKLDNIKVSAKGDYYIAEYSQMTPPEGKMNKWFEVYTCHQNKLIQSVKNTTFSALKWLTKGNAYSYKNEAGFWIYNLDDATLKPYLKNVSMDDYKWSSDGHFIIYSVSESAPNKNKLAHRLVDMEDRWPWFRSRSFLYKFDLNTGIKERLTFGNLTTVLQDIRRDGSHILFSEEKIDNTTRPYTKQLMCELNLQTMKLDTLWVKPFGGRASYSPDGQKIVVIGSPIMFGDIGKNIVNHKIANDFDEQAFIFDLKTKDVKAISWDFDPSIKSAYWKDKNSIYFMTVDKTYVNLYEYDFKNGHYELIDQPLDVINAIQFSNNSDMAGVVSNGINTAEQGYLLNLKSKSFKKCVDSEKDFFKDVKLGATQDWVYKMENGTELDGFIYFPPNFDASKKYPLIVYYYAGTSPIDRNFRGRYPKPLYAAHGYVVYVVNPSGTIGYGQEFSAAHVNNWGITVADEIIESTKAFTKAHSFVDKSKIACMGASYGGFMTMLLMTKTDIFATAISHAGISSLSSYWGEGYWGYLYSSTASANSFPWNNRKLYVDQSPLFNADKVVNPMLLIHGSVDTNVPIGESIQMYTALKLLGKPVELVQILGQDHHILEYKRRVFWQKTIAAWFDKQLKNEPEWWNALYPDHNLK